MSEVRILVCVVFYQIFETGFAALERRLMRPRNFRC